MFLEIMEISVISFFGNLNIPLYLMELKKALLKSIHHPDI